MLMLPPPARSPPERIVIRQADRVKSSRKRTLSKDRAYTATIEEEETKIKIIQDTSILENEQTEDAIPVASVSSSTQQTATVEEEEEGGKDIGSTAAKAISLTPSRSVRKYQTDIEGAVPVRNIRKFRTSISGVSPVPNIRRYQSNITVTPVVPFELPSDLSSDEDLSPVNKSVMMAVMHTHIFVILKHVTIMTP